MDIDFKHIEQLVKYDLSGTIQPEEKEYLDKVVKTNVEARRIYDALKSQFSEEQLDKVSSTLTERFLQENPAFSPRRSVKRPVFIISIISAAAAIIVFLIVFRYQPNRPAAEMAQHATKGVELKLASGQSFNLSKQTGTINSGEAVLNNANKNLSVLTSPEVVQMATLNVPNGMDYKVQLSDGTSIHLNAGSSLSFPLSFPSGSREITIAGEAYIVVKTDEKKPFYVRFDRGTIQVLGTEFNINTYDNEVDKIALVSGRIKILSSNDSVILKPGHEARVRSQQVLQVAAFDPYDVLSWKEGEYPFSNVTLAELGILIERYYGVAVKVDNSAATSKFTGVISRKTSIREFLTGLNLTGFVKQYSFDEKGALHISN